VSVTFAEQPAGLFELPYGAVVSPSFPGS
jgi:hypothetical protein